MKLLPVVLIVSALAACHPKRIQTGFPRVVRTEPHYSVVEQRPNIFLILATSRSAGEDIANDVLGCKASVCTIDIAGTVLRVETFRRDTTPK